MSGENPESVWWNHLSQSLENLMHVFHETDELLQNQWKFSNEEENVNDNLDGSASSSSKLMTNWNTRMEEMVIYSKKPYCGIQCQRHTNQIQSKK